MKKSFVLDTNVLIHDPDSIEKFEDNDIYIPIYVIEELDKLKAEQTLRGRNARVACRKLDDLRYLGKVSEGVQLDGGGKLCIYVPAERKRISVGLDNNSMDNAILQTAMEVKEKSALPTILVTMDVNLRVRADALELQTAAYESQSIDPETIASGIVEVMSTGAEIDAMYANGKVDTRPEVKTDLYKNACIELKDEITGRTALGRYRMDERIHPVRLPKEGILGIKPRNREQQFALDLLLDDDLSLVSLTGVAGSGKSLLTLAAGLSKILEGKYTRLLVSRPVVPMGKDLGYLPGPQPLDSKIVTSNGWVAMGDLKIGDFVIGRNGKPTKVLGIYPKGKKEIYKVTTSDGTSTECCADHLWHTRTFEDRKRGKEGCVKSTLQIIDSLKTSKDKINHYLPRNEAVEYRKNDLPLPPYVLGVLLGDGNIGDYISISNTDIDLIKRCEKELSLLNCILTNDGKNITYNIKSYLKNNKPAKPIRITKNGKCKDYYSIGCALEDIDINRSTLHNRCENKLEIDGARYEFLECPVRWQNPVKEILETLGLSNTYAWNKFIPDLYKYSSIEDRVDILRGLMDTDGTVKKSGEASYTTTSEKLAKDVIELVRSLGGRASLCKRDRIGKSSKLGDRKITTRRVSYEFTISLPAEINPFYISRKADRFSCSHIFGVGIESIEKAGEKDVQCILVESPEHLYLTDDFIVTHNTIDEKLAPWMQPIYDNLELLMMSAGKKKTSMTMDDMIDQGMIKIEPLTYIRGRSIPGQFMILDEAQNLNTHEIKTIITRCGEGTKIVLTGDPQQIDSPYLDQSSCGLSVAVDKLHDNDIVGHLTLTKGERSELANLAAKNL